jgi:hypothetical protein
MRRSRVSYSAFLVLCLAAGTFAQDARTKAAGPGIEEKINAVLAADDPESAAERFTALFAAAGESGLAELRKSAHDSIAIQAAWEQVVRTVPKTTESMNPPYRLNREKLRQFLEFLEGRTRLRLPKWWSQAILEASAYRRTNLYFPTPSLELLVRSVTGGTVAVRIGDVTVTKKGNIFSLQVARDSIDLPTELRDRVLESGGYVAGYFTSKSCYFADYESHGATFTLARLDRSTGRIVWKTAVWGSYWGSGGGGLPRGPVTIIQQGDRVVVFGSASGIYVEAFRADDGKNLFRFSNGYSWGN